MRRLGQLAVVIVGLGATIATSPPRWSVEAPDVPAVTDTLDATTPTGEVAFVVRGSPELAAREGAHFSYGMVGTATWEGASDPTASSVLHLDYDGLTSWSGGEPQPSADVVLRPGQSVKIDTINPTHTECGETCRFTMRARYRWEQPDGRVEISWTPTASARGVLGRREEEPSKAAVVTVTELK